MVLATAERLSGARAAQLVQALDAGEVALEREGVARRSPSRFGVVALDEGLEVDERPPAALCDRLAFRLDLSAVTPEQVEQPGFERDAVAAARTRQAAVAVDEETMRALCETAMALGIDSLRAPLLALRVARAAAAWDGRTRVTREEIGLAEFPN